METSWHPIGPCHSQLKRHWLQHMSATPSASTLGSECLFLSGAPGQRFLEICDIAMEHIHS